MKRKAVAAKNLPSVAGGGHSHDNTSCADDGENLCGGNVGNSSSDGTDALNALLLLR